MSEQVYQQVITLMPKLRRFAYGLCGSTDGADDLIQEACSRLLGCAAEVEGYLDRWLYRTIRNVHIDQVRHALVKERYQDEMAGRSPAAVDGSEHVESLVTLDQIRELIAALPEDQRVTLMLVGVEGHSYREAAEILGLPIGTVTSRIARARARLVDAISNNPARQQGVAGGRDGTGER